MTANTPGQGKSSLLDLIAYRARMLGHPFQTVVLVTTQGVQLRRLYNAAHAELAAMASDVADPNTDPDRYVAAYWEASATSPAWAAYRQAQDAMPWPKTGQS